MERRSRRGRPRRDFLMSRQTAAATRLACSLCAIITSRVARSTLFFFVSHYFWSLEATFASPPPPGLMYHEHNGLGI